jgi:hypothetical protein
MPEKKVVAMKPRSGTYTTYSIACGVVWAVILVVTASIGSENKRDTLLLVCGGWAMGWLSATIARAVYPPPKVRRPADQTAG